ncbi:hypothetical protein QU585_10145 [Lactiplantibacillus plantarum]|uniref:hypothetical protein n=1 Tax=Lactiplantibacillus plantarum TaxID=1590 RepID=UPI0027414F21|nr:hypothetical protein [Lactiplantibacillus plantarum]MDP5372517.1 hypothetical protein [Lactiplantibacillus plantarum]
MTVQQAVAIIAAQFPLTWSQIGDKPAIITSAELQAAVQAASQLTSPDGTVWEPTIDNDGKVTWQKKGVVE